MEGAGDSSISKALVILGNFGADVSHLGVSELARRTGFPKSTVHRLCRTLTAGGWLEQTKDNRYRLGLQVFELGSAGLVHAQMRQRTSRFLQQLTVVTGETAHLGVLDGDEVVYIDKIETPQSETVPSQVGQRNPAHCTAIGKVLLAWTEHQRDFLANCRTLPTYTPHTLVTQAALKEELCRIRRDAVAYDRQERVLGIGCVAAALKDRAGRVVAAISIAGPSDRMTDERMRDVAPFVARIGAAAGTYLNRRSVAV